MFKQNKKREGFTLVELLVVIAIIGLLSTLSLVALSSARQKARDALRTSDVKQVMTALELYYSDASLYPAYVYFKDGGTIATGSPLNTYLAVVPKPPVPSSTPDGACPTSNFVYAQDKAGGSYHITYCVAGATGGLASGNHTATPAGIANP